jgi:hypothetical protein
MRPLTEEVLPTLAFPPTISIFSSLQLAWSRKRPALLTGDVDILQETRAVFEKLHKFLGKNLKNLVERTDEGHVFRLHKNRIFYVRESLLRRATNVSALSS